jgi:hypothetical protein
MPEVRGNNQREERRAAAAFNAIVVQWRRSARSQVTAATLGTERVLAAAFGTERVPAAALGAERGGAAAPYARQERRRRTRYRSGGARGAAAKRVGKVGDKIRKVASGAGKKTTARFDPIERACGGYKDVIPPGHRIIFLTKNRKCDHIPHMHPPS